MAMDLCIDEKDEERESEAQSVVRAKKRARGERGGARFFALTADCASLSRSSSFLVDAKVHSHLNCHVSRCFRLFF